MRGRPAALQEVHGLAVADGARGALPIRLQALSEQPVGLLQPTYLSELSRGNAVQTLMVACHMHCDLSPEGGTCNMMQERGPKTETSAA